MIMLLILASSSEPLWVLKSFKEAVRYLQFWSSFTFAVKFNIVYEFAAEIVLLVKCVSVKSN